jgi:hypothetical protein
VSLLGGRNLRTVSPIIEDIFLHVDEKLCRERSFPSIPQDIRFAFALQAMAGVGIVRKAIWHSKGFADWRTTPLFEEMYGFSDIKCDFAFATVPSFSQSSLAEIEFAYEYSVEFLILLDDADDFVGYLGSCFESYSKGFVIGFRATDGILKWKLTEAGEEFLKSYQLSSAYRTPILKGVVN